jgi:hypothetical protein
MSYARRLSYFTQVIEQIKVEYFIAIGTVKTFQISVLVRFARLNILDHHPGCPGPAEKGMTEKLRAVVNSEDMRQALHLLQTLE